MQVSTPGNAAASPAPVALGYGERGKTRTKTRKACGSKSPAKEASQGSEPGKQPWTDGAITDSPSTKGMDDDSQARVPSMHVSGDSGACGGGNGAWSEDPLAV